MGKDGFEMLDSCPRLCGSSNATSGPDCTLHREAFSTRVVLSEVSRIPGGNLSKYLLRLFITGESPRSATAIANLKRICDQELQGAYDLEIIDVLEHPDMAEDEKILATPTLIKSLPLPLRRVIGDLSDREKVLLGLQVQPNVDLADMGGSAS